MSRRLNAAESRLSRTSSTPIVPCSSTSGTATMERGTYAGLLGERAPEPSVVLDVGEGECLTGRIDVAGEALRSAASTSPITPWPCSPAATRTRAGRSTRRRARSRPLQPRRARPSRRRPSAGPPLRPALQPPRGLDPSRRRRQAAASAAPLSRGRSGSLVTVPRRRLEALEPTGWPRRPGLEPDRARVDEIGEQAVHGLAGARRSWPRDRTGCMARPAGPRRSRPGRRSWRDGRGAARAARAGRGNAAPRRGR